MAYINTWRRDQGYNLLMLGNFSDVTIIVDYDDEPIQEIKAHKCILHLTSTVWEAMINWSEDNKIIITSFPYEVVMTLLKLMYTGEMILNSMEHCIGIIRALDFYDMENQIHHCWDYVYEYMKRGVIVIEDIVNILNISVQIDISILKSYCLVYIEDNANKFFKSEEFLSITFDTMEFLLKLQNYLCPEEFLIRTCMRWCDAQRKNVPLKDYVLRSGIIDLFRLEVLTKEEKLSFLSVFPGVFNHKILPMREYNPRLARMHSRGATNIFNSDVIHVRTPPFIYKERFTHFGIDFNFMLNSIVIPRRCNSIDEKLTTHYEEKMKISIFDDVVNFEGDVSPSSNPVIQLEVPRQIYLRPGSTYTMTATFYRPGVYYKNFYSDFLLQ